MTTYGYTLMTEQSGPRELVGYAAAAEQAGSASARGEPRRARGGPGLAAGQRRAREVNAELPGPSGFAETELLPALRAG